MGEWGVDIGMVVIEGGDGRRNAFVDDVEKKVAMTVASVVLVIDAIMSIRFFSNDDYVFPPRRSPDFLLIRSICDQ